MDIFIDFNELNFTFVRSSGAGGQNVNKVNSKAVLRWSPLQSRSVSHEVIQRFIRVYQARLTENSEIIISSDIYRDQIRNRDECVKRLYKMLAAVARPQAPRIATQPTKASKRRRLTQKRLTADKKSGRAEGKRVKASLLSRRKSEE